MTKHHKAFAAALMIAAVAFGGAATASAEPKVDPVNGPGRGCPIVHEDDNGNVVKVEYASPGTRNGASCAAATASGASAGPPATPARSRAASQATDLRPRPTDHSPDRHSRNRGQCTQPRITMDAGPA